MAVSPAIAASCAVGREHGSFDDTADHQKRSWARIKWAVNENSKVSDSNADNIRSELGSQTLSGGHSMESVDCRPARIMDISATPFDWSILLRQS